MDSVKNVVGYRLSMSPNQPFRQSQSIQVYKGIVGKIMLLLKLALSQQFEDENGKLVILAVNKKSLAHYIWRHNRCRDVERGLYSPRMGSLYKISHRVFTVKNQAHKSYTREMCHQIGKRALLNKESIKINDFVEKVRKQAPLIGNFYKIKKDGKTLGYLLGTIHVGNELLLNLNPKINKALSKSKIIAGEQPIDEIGKETLCPEKI